MASCTRCLSDVGTGGIVLENGQLLCATCDAALKTGMLSTEALQPAETESGSYVFVNWDYPIAVFFFVTAVAVGTWSGMLYGSEGHWSLNAGGLAAVTGFLALGALLGFFFPRRVKLNSERKLVEIRRTFWLWQSELPFSDFIAVEISWFNYRRNATVFSVRLDGPQHSILVGQSLRLKEIRALGKHVAKMMQLPLDDSTLKVPPRDQAKEFREGLPNDWRSSSRPHQLHLSTLIVLVFEAGIAMLVLIRCNFDNFPIAVGASLLAILGTYGVMERRKYIYPKRRRTTHLK